jgi:hypothetical protein
MKRGAGVPLGERAEGVTPPGSGVGRHVWVYDGSRCPGVLLEWRQSSGAWEGRVAYVSESGTGPRLTVAWLPAALMRPAEA